ncbi:hypothetical protein [Halomicrobium salinisoli]|uniref:hypothetical protein n=1 Tax=Halomicrobium salinisoli TaxID=2878391 RepID=UPI001CF0BE82|nr:hypothetical protein [Halomicrobium salinisoli]
MNVPRPFGSDDGDETVFDDYDEFRPDHEPEPGPFLAGHDVLEGREHAALHRLARARFEDNGVYDMTFGYNLARLNLDRRHEDAGFRYAREADDPTVLRAEFTPTTEFCPQSDTLTVAAFRAWNDDPSLHEFDLVSVRVAPMHQRDVAINGRLEQLEEQFLETGEVTVEDAAAGAPGGTDDGVDDAPDVGGTPF